MSQNRIKTTGDPFAAFRWEFNDVIVDADFSNPEFFASYMENSKRMQNITLSDNANNPMQNSIEITAVVREFLNEQFGDGVGEKMLPTNSANISFACLESFLEYGNNQMEWMMKTPSRMAAFSNKTNKMNALAEKALKVVGRHETDGNKPA